MAPKRLVSSDTVLKRKSPKGEGESKKFPKILSFLGEVQFPLFSQ